MSLCEANVVVRRNFWLSFSGRSILIIGNEWELGYPLFSNCAYDEMTLYCYIGARERRSGLLNQWHGFNTYGVFTVVMLLMRWMK
jgi:Gpi18-like mannosyltransferase